MDYSLDECRKLVCQAARGVNLPWGLAQDAADAAAWLTARRLPLLISNVLVERDNLCAPIVNPPQWLTMRAALCPIITGCHISDCAQEKLPRRLYRVAQPLLLLPFIARVILNQKNAKTLTTPYRFIELTWHNTRLVTDGDNIDLINAKSLTIACADVSIRPIARYSFICRQCHYKTSAQEWRQLRALAKQTYVRASTQSRAGAGAGVSDND